MHATRHLNKAGYGINTYSFTRTLRARECLAQLADLGYRRFEIMLVPGHFWPSLDGDAGRRDIESSSWQHWRTDNLAESTES